MMQLGKTICTLSNEVDASVLIVGINIHEMDRFIPYE
jgi:hypothetical protein